MAKKIAFLNQKGGVGKTTNTINIGMAFKNSGHKVLLIDSDPQCSLRDWSDENGGSSIPVIAADTVSSISNISAVESGYDIIIIDGAPQSSKLSGAAVRVSDLAIIPVTPSPYDIWASSDIVDVISERILNTGKLKAAFLISRAIEGTNLVNDVLEALNGVDIPLLSNKTIQRQIYPKSAASGHTVFDFGTVAAKKAQDEINLIANEIGGLLWG